MINGNQAGNLDAHKPIGMSSVFRGLLYMQSYGNGAEIFSQNLPLLNLLNLIMTERNGPFALKGLEFHHGKTITADDVIFSLRRLTDPKLASPFAAYLYSLQRDAIKKRDEYTVEIPFLKERDWLLYQKHG